jgi:hypothetical protein
MLETMAAAQTIVVRLVVVVVLVVLAETIRERLVAQAEMA